MAQHNVLGKLGEQLAEEYLKERGYDILYRNWRYRQYEIDIIAMKGTMLHFVEVKTRASNLFGFPEENVTRKKILSLFKAADEFLYQNQQYKEIQFDILAINKYQEQPAEYFLLQDVYI